MTFIKIPQTPAFAENKMTPDPCRVFWNFWLQPSGPWSQKSTEVCRYRLRIRGNLRDIELAVS